MIDKKMRHLAVKNAGNVADILDLQDGPDDLVAVKDRPGVALVVVSQVVKMAALSNYEGHQEPIIMLLDDRHFPEQNVFGGAGAALHQAQGPIAARARENSEADRMS